MRISPKLADSVVVAADCPVGDGKIGIKFDGALI